MVVAIARGDIPTPSDRLTADAGGDTVVCFLDGLVRAESKGKRVCRDPARGVGNLVGQAIVLVGVRVPLPPGAERIKLRVATTQRKGRIEGQQGRVIGAVALDQVQIRVAGRVLLVGVRVSRRVDHAGIDGTAITVAVVADLGRQIQIAVLQRLESRVAGDILGAAAAVVVSTVRGGHVAACGILFENDVDDARDRVGAVLRGGPFGEHLDVVDGFHGNQIEIRCGTPLVGSIEHGQVGCSMPPLAVDENQRVVGTQAAQLDLQRLVGLIATERLCGE